MQVPRIVNPLRIGYYTHDEGEDPTISGPQDGFVSSILLLIILSSLGCAVTFAFWLTINTPVEFTMSVVYLLDVVYMLVACLILLRILKCDQPNELFATIAVKEPSDVIQSDGEVNVSQLYAWLQGIIRNKLPLIGIAFFYTLSLVPDLLWIIGHIQCLGTFSLCGMLEEIISSMMKHSIHIFFMGLAMVFCFKFYDKVFVRSWRSRYSIATLIAVTVLHWFETVLYNSKDLFGPAAKYPDQNMSCILHQPHVINNGCLYLHTEVYLKVGTLMPYFYPFTVQFFLLVLEILFHLYFGAVSITRIRQLNAPPAPDRVVRRSASYAGSLSLHSECTETSQYEGAGNDREASSLTRRKACQQSNVPLLMNAQNPNYGSTTGEQAPGGRPVDPTGTEVITHADVHHTQAGLRLDEVQPGAENKDRTDQTRVPTEQPAPSSSRPGVQDESIVRLDESLNSQRTADVPTTGIPFPTYIHPRSTRMNRLFFIAIIFNVLFVTLGVLTYEELNSQQWITVYRAFRPLAWVLLITATSVALQITRVFPVRFHSYNGFELFVLFSTTGVYIYIFLSITAKVVCLSNPSGCIKMMKDPEDDQEYLIYISLIDDLLNGVQVYMQTVFMLHAGRLQARHGRTGRRLFIECVLYTVISNFTVWLIDSFVELKNTTLEPIQDTVFGKGWGIILHIILPIGFFYRFNSFIILLKIYLDN